MPASSVSTACRHRRLPLRSNPLPINRPPAADVTWCSPRGATLACMRATPDGRDPEPEPDPDLADLDPDDAFGHPAVADPARDDTVWPDGEGDDDDIDV